MVRSTQTSKVLVSGTKRLHAVYGQLIDQFADTSIAGGDDLKQFRFENDYKKVTTYTGGTDKLHDRTYVTL